MDTATIIITIVTLGLFIVPIAILNKRGQKNELSDKDAEKDSENK